MDFLLYLCSPIGLQTMEETSKEYYFSYDKLHKQLNAYCSVSKEMFNRDSTEFDVLCLEIWYSAIGDYSEVEWHRLGINTESIVILTGGYSAQNIPCLAMDILHVLVYWRDHAHEVLPPDEDDVSAKLFEIECCKLIKEYKTICEVELQSQREELGEWGKYLDGPMYVSVYGNDYVVDKVKDIQHFMTEYMESEEWRIIWENCPENKEDIDHGPFPYAMIVHLAIMKYGDIMDMLHSYTDKKTINEYITHFDFEALRIEIRGLFVKLSGRYIAIDNGVIVLVLWLISLFLLTDRDYTDRKEKYFSIYKQLSENILFYIENLKTSYVVAGLRQANNLVAEVLMSNLKEVPEEKQSIAPDDSIFRVNSMDYEMCKEKLLYILNNSRTKLEVCRKLKEQRNSIYFNTNQQNTVLARILNTWVPLITNQKNKRWEFKDDDFRKS